jgi:hypothetical protein
MRRTIPCTFLYVDLTAIGSTIQKGCEKVIIHCIFLKMLGFLLSRSSFLLICNVPNDILVMIHVQAFALHFSFSQLDQSTPFLIYCTRLPYLAI